MSVQVFQKAIADVADFQRALEAVKAIANVQVQFQTQQSDLPQLFERDEVQSIIINLDVETRDAIRSIIRVYQELQRS